MTIFSGALGIATPQPIEAGSKRPSLPLKPGSLAVYAPPPFYPYEARDKRMEGSGIALLKVDSRTGYVTSAQMSKSTGHKILDDAALEAFRQWRFKPGTRSHIKAPITFSMRGVRY